MQRDRQIVMRGGHIHADGCDALFRNLKIDKCVGGRIFHHANRMIRQKILVEHLFFAGLKPGKIRLIVGIDAGHQFDIRAVFVRQIAIPRLAEIAAAPCPLLFAGRNVMIRDMQDARLSAVIIAADKVVFGLNRHVGGRHGDVFIARNIHARGVIHFVIRAGGDGKAGNVALAVIKNGVNVGRENRLIVIVDRYRRIRPPEEMLRHGGSVIQLAGDFQIRFIGKKRKTRHAFGAKHPLHFADPDRRAAVVVRFERKIDRLERAGAVMLRPVEFDAAGNPGAGQPN